MDLFVGIDVAVAKSKRLPIAFLSRAGKKLTVSRLKDLPGCLPPIGIGNARLVREEKGASNFARDAADYVCSVTSKLGGRLRRISIDAPRTPHFGSFSLRPCEADLHDRDIPFYQTPTCTEFAEILDRARRHLDQGGSPAKMPEANRIWMLAGFKLFKVLESRFPDAELLEVYPHATFAIVGAAADLKSGDEGSSARLEALAAGLHMDECALSDALPTACWGARHDKIDALSAAWISSLCEVQRQRLGSVPADAIWAPKTP